MMGRAPRQPVDLQAVTNDVKAKIRRAIGELEAIEQQHLRNREATTAQALREPCAPTAGLRRGFAHMTSGPARSQL